MKKNRDHRLINKILNLYHISDSSPGMIFWLNNGLIILQNIKKILRKKLKKYKYTEVTTACLINQNMWIKSGHWKNYKKFIFHTKFDNKIFCVKPMNCLGHLDIYKQNIKSYKNLPIRIAEFGICHRNEKSGSLHGLMRTKSFIQDDAHIFCTKKQIYKEISKCIDMIYEIYNIFGFKKIDIFVSTKPKEFIGNTKIWKIAEKEIINTLNKKKIKFKIKKKEGAFYGPKIEFILEDSLKRKWQCGTIQLDFFLSKKLKAYYINKENKKKNPIIIHRAILGSLERFIGILIEEYNGKLPIWLTPIKTVVINISEKHTKYCKYVLKKLIKNDINSIGDFRNKKINFKIREHTLQKIPYMIVCGDKEIFYKNISVKIFSKKKLFKIDLNKFIYKIKLKIKKFK